MAQEPLELLQGTLDLLVLRCLVLGPMHGYGISNAIRERTGGAIYVVDAALYKALYRLERDDLLVATWGVSENNRRAKYYTLGAAGRRRLREEEARWRRYAAAVDRLLKPA
jgi:PadR family transcriptional regulator PadR